MEGRLASLRAVADALIPPLEERAAAVATVDPRAATLFRHSGCSDEVLYKVIELIEVRLPPEARRELFLLLRLMGSRLGSVLLLGRAAFSSRLSLPTSFRDLPRQQREAVLQSWSASPDPRMRKAFKGLKSLILSVQFSYLAPDGTSDLLAAMRYPITDPQRPALPAPAAAAAETAVTAALVDLSAHDSSPGSAAGAGAALAAKGMRVLWPGDFGGSAAAAREHPQLAVQCDVVVVGSGAGGGVVAANLARAGLKVVVLEKAGFVPAREMSLQEGETFRSMYEQGGILASEDASITVLAGSTLGGGTRVNWCASFKTPAHVRREWAEEHGLPAFASPAYDEALEAVCSRLGVHTGFKHSGMCSALQGGLQGLGVHCEEVPRNCLNPDCGGHCCLGCARGGKQDTVNTWLADACQAGARIITGVSAERVILDSNTGVGRSKGGHSRGRKAVGVLALAGTTADPLRLAILASTVVSSAGTIHSPALLLRSGISCGGAVGTNLRLHPCTCVVGVFPPGHRQQPQQQQGQGQAPQQPATGRPVGDLEDLAGAPGSRTGGQEAQPQQEQQQQEQRRLHMVPGQEGGSIRCWEGTLMSIFSNQVGDWEGSGYGSLLYTPAVHPGLFAAAAPWVSGEDHKELMLQYADCCIVLVLVRDQDAGRVTIDRSGRPRIHYTLSKRDEGSMNKGIELGLRCMAAAGAHTVLTMLNSPAGRFAFTQLGDAPGEGTGSGSGGAAGSGNPAGGGDSQANGAAGDAAAGQQEAVLAGSAAGGREAFESYLERVAQAGVVPLQMPLFCAHQMGTCRLGASPTMSVTDMSGECWDVAGLFCMDGSALPTSTGVNPMISIEATAYMLSKQLGARLIKATGAANSGGGNKRHDGKRRASPSPKL